MDRLKQFITSGFSEVRSSFGQHASQGGFSILDKIAWKKDLDDRWKERTEAIRSGYDAVVKKVEKGEELTEEDIRVINRYVHENPHLTLAPSIQNALYNFSVNRNIDDMVQKLVDGGKLPIEAYTKFKELVDSDAASRISQVMAFLPKPLVNSILVSDGFWEILASVEKSGAKGAKAVSLILNGLSKYEAWAVKYDKLSVLIDEASSLVQNIASPVRAVATSTFLIRSIDSKNFQASLPLLLVGFLVVFLSVEWIYRKFPHTILEVEEFHFENISLEEVLIDATKRNNTLMKFFIVFLLITLIFAILYLNMHLFIFLFLSLGMFVCTALLAKYQIFKRMFVLHKIKKEYI